MRLYELKLKLNDIISWAVPKSTNGFLLSFFFFFFFNHAKYYGVNVLCITNNVWKRCCHDCNIWYTNHVDLSENGAFYFPILVNECVYKACTPEFTRLRKEQRSFISGQPKLWPADRKIIPI